MMGENEDLLITLQNWYQLDFQLPISNQQGIEDIPMQDKETTLLKIANVISELMADGLVDMWFFLDEVRTIRVRMRADDGDTLKEKLEVLAASEGLGMSKRHPFSEYQEEAEAMLNEPFMEFFAKVMSLTTELTISKLREEIEFDPLRGLERIHHCTFNNMASLSSETEVGFLLQRLVARTGRLWEPSA
jgi:hypothetical protein